MQLAKPAPTIVSSRGLGTIGVFLLLVGLAFFLVISYGIFLETRKAYWDDKVRGFCKQDGGGAVLSTVTVKKDEHAHFLNRFGKLEIPMDLPETTVDIVQRRSSSYIRRNSPEVRRDETLIVRKSDGAVLAKNISYSRIGGDAFAFHPSYYSCPQDSIDIHSAVIHVVN